MEEQIMTFKAIETQEELEAVLSDRLKRAEKQHEEKAAEIQRQFEEAEKKIAELTTTNDSMSKTITENQEKYANADKTIEELNSKISAYETDSTKTKIAIELGLPMELKDTIQGSDEESMRQNAETLSKYIKTKEAPPPFNPEPPIKQGSDAEYGALLKNLNTGKE
jgi:chromosome segregation ATPase